MVRAPFFVACPGVDSGEYLAEDFGRTHGAYGGIVEAEVAQGSVENGVALSV